MRIRGWFRNLGELSNSLNTIFPAWGSRVTKISWSMVGGHVTSTVGANHQGVTDKVSADKGQPEEAEKG